MSEPTARCCKGVNDISYWVDFEGNDLDDDEDDDDDLDYDDVEGGEMLVKQYSRCLFVADPDSDLCGKHRFLSDNGVNVKLAKDDEK